MLFLHRRIHRNNIYIKHIMRRYYCHNTDNMSKIRNIGILAHIDAGKISNYFIFSPQNVDLSNYLSHLLLL